MFEEYKVAKAAGEEVAVQPKNEKWHITVARSPFSSENTACSKHFLTLLFKVKTSKN